MEDLLDTCFAKRAGFENFKSSVCHRLKELGDIDFIIDVLRSGEIRTLLERRWYPEALYLLAMLDYISRENGVPLCTDYDDVRRYRLEKPVYPAGIRIRRIVENNEDALRQAENTAIPEFRRFNIMESEVRAVV